MDDHVFRQHVAACKSVSEETSCLELFNYSDPAFNSLEERTVPTYDFEDFLQEKGQFAPPAQRHGVKLVSGMRLIVQKDAKHAETFAPHVLSLSHGAYETMVRVLHLSPRSIEGTSVVGPFFWSSYSTDAEDTRLQIIFRKSDTRRQGKTEGWDISLSYSFTTGITTGFVKGTATSQVAECLDSLKTCAGDVAHPLLLPLLLLSHDLGAKRDEQLRATRDWVRRLERDISQRLGSDDDDAATAAAGRAGSLRVLPRGGGGSRPGRAAAGGGPSDVQATTRALVECHAQVLRKRPADWLEIIGNMETTMRRFRDRVPAARWTAELDALHAALGGRLDFYRIKLRGIEGYAHTTMERLDIQRSALAGIMAHRESVVTLQMVSLITDQRRIAQASKRDGNAIKRLSILGAVFFPGTFLSSIFSMVFFSVQSGDSGKGTEFRVAPQLWIYFAAMIPLTLAVVAFVWLWDRKRERRVKAQARELDVGVEAMERDIMVQMSAQRSAARKTGFGEKEDEEDFY